MVNNSTSQNEKEEYRQTITVLSNVLVESGNQSVSKFNTAIENISGQLTLSGNFNPAFLNE